jgi:hypothetical protein
MDWKFSIGIFIGLLGLGASMGNWIGPEVGIAIMIFAFVFLIITLPNWPFNKKWRQQRKADQALLLMLREQGILPSQTDSAIEAMNIPSPKLKNEIHAELRKLYKDGVSLWNKGMNLDGVEEVEPWIKEFETWETMAIAVIEKRSELDVADFETLRLMPLLQFPKAINERHVHYLRVFSEKLNRLNQIMRRLRDA